MKRLFSLALLIPIITNKLPFGSSIFGTLSSLKKSSFSFGYSRFFKLDSALKSQIPKSYLFVMMGITLFISTNAMGSWHIPIDFSSQGTQKTRHFRALRPFQVWTGNEENTAPLFRASSSPTRMQTKKKRPPLKALPSTGSLKKKRKHVQFSEKPPEVRTYTLPVEKKSKIKRTVSCYNPEDFQKAQLAMSQPAVEPKKKKLRKPTKKINITAEKKERLKAKFSQQKDEWLRSATQKVSFGKYDELTQIESDTYFAEQRRIAMEVEEAELERFKAQHAGLYRARDISPELQQWLYEKMMGYH